MGRRSAARPGRGVRGDALSFASGALEGAGTQFSPEIYTEQAGTISALLDVTAVSGSPTLDVTLQTTEDANPATATWVDVASFAQKTGVANERKRFTGLGVWCRWKRVLAGTATPKATYTITGYTK